MDACLLLLFFSVLSQKIGREEERLQNDLFCVGWDVKLFTQSVNLMVLQIYRVLVRQFSLVHFDISIQGAGVTEYYVFDSFVYLL